MQLCHRLNTQPAAAMRRLQSLIAGWHAVLQTKAFDIAATTTAYHHATKARAADSHRRPVTPTGAQRPAIALEHHLSPMPGHHPDIPADAAVAISTPPRRHDQNADLQSPSENISPNGAGPIPAVTPAPQSALATEPAQTIVSNGGARAAYTATQQQRIITCNLAAIPTST